MNNKNIGEIGERIAIGELAKFGIDVILPMTDNLPFDFVIFANNKFYKCQVKSSSKRSKDSIGSVQFGLTTSNWYKKTERVYTGKDIDIFILCDGTNIYLFRQKDLDGKKNIAIRTEISKNNQSKGVNLASQVIISKDRLDYVLQ